SLQDYESKALELAQNRQVLDAMKQKLIAERLTSALFDTAKFAVELEVIYQNMWAEHRNQIKNS
ncbi:MAG TPA: glycosyltransferase, partial [Methylotenera sp.]